MIKDNGPAMLNAAARAGPVLLNGATYVANGASRVV